MEFEDAKDALAFFVSSPPSTPPPSAPVPPFGISLKSCDSIAALSLADVVGVCMVLLLALLPLGIPTKWLWFEWLVNRSFISS